MSMVLILSQTLLTAQSETRFDGLAYYAPLYYRHSNAREGGYVTGVYTYLGHGVNHSLESVLDFTRMRYKGGLDIDQWDLTAVYTHYSPTSTNYRLGVHYLKSDDPFSNHAITLFTGVNQHVPYQRNLGVDGYVTLYHNYLPGLTVFQVTPKIGFHIGNQVQSGFYVESKGYYIGLSDELGTDGHHFYSLEESVRYYRGNLSVTVLGWAGEQVFAVRNDGMVLYNLAELHRGGYGGSIRYVLGPSTSFGFGAFAEVFSDIGETNEATSTRLVFSLGHTF